MEKIIQDLEGLADEAGDFARALRPRAAGATLITLSGELGAGKTAFTKEVARALGVTDTVTSPTFVLEKVYALPECDVEQLFTRLIHIDAYRLERGAELAPLGFDELMRSSRNLVMLEWPEKVADALPPPAVSITITPQPDGTRTISYD